MSRTDHFIGLNPKAKKLINPTLKVQEIGIRVYPDGTIEKFDHEVDLKIKVQREVIDEVGVWTKFPLYNHELPSGEVYIEYLQAQPWAGGPYYFVALKDKKGEVVAQSLWSDEEIESLI